MTQAPPPTVGPVRILSVAPAVLLTGIPYEDYLGVARVFAGHFGNVDAGFIVFPTWTLEREGFPEAIRERHAAHIARFPRHRFRFIGNASREVELLRAQGLQAELLNHNLAVSDSIFRPLPGVEAEFDAVYNARFVSYKRHELAALVPRVAYIAYVEPEPHRHAEFTVLHQAAMARNPGHVLLNEMKDGRPLPMPHDQVNAAMARARVGIVLSAVEGASYCSMEYMLAGLPVVSTPSLGGRDVFFDPDYCIVCPPDPAAVRDAVAELKARNIPREVIRARTLEKIAPARARLLELVDEVVAELGGKYRLAGRDWPFGDWSGVRWGYYASHLAMFAAAQRVALARSLGLHPQLVSGVQLTAGKLELVVRAIRARRGCRLLVFGCGNDSPFWEAVNAGGTTTFVEDNPQWASAAQRALSMSRVHLVKYDTRAADWRELLDAPPRLELALPPDITGQAWDVILVDGPAGYEPSSPGRMKSIFSASRLVAPGGMVFLDDCERETEAAFAARFLGEQRLVAQVRGGSLFRGYKF